MIVCVCDRSKQFNTIRIRVVCVIGCNEREHDKRQTLAEAVNNEVNKDNRDTGLGRQPGEGPTSIVECRGY